MKLIDSPFPPRFRAPACRSPASPLVGTRQAGRRIQPGVDGALGRESRSWACVPRRIVEMRAAGVAGEGWESLFMVTLWFCGLAGLALFLFSG